MRPETGRVDMLLVGGATVMQIVGLLVLHHIGALELGAFWRWWVTFL
jgi:hypothetical protein